MIRSFNYIDLFSGAGGLSLGFSNAGFKLEFANDFSREAIDTFKYNLKISHPEIDKSRVILGDIKEIYQILGVDNVEHKFVGDKIVTTKKDQRNKFTTQDVEKLKLSSILDSLVEVDLLIGGPPCQGFSLIGRSKKMTFQERKLGFIDDPKNQLFRYFLKFAEKFSPKIILIENVKGLASAGSYRDLIENSIASTGFGYKVCSKILNAKDFGIPQNRERIFFIGIRNDINIKPDSIFENLESLKIEENKLESAIIDLPRLNSNPLPRNNEVVDEIVDSEHHQFFGLNVWEIPELQEINKSSYVNEINTFKGVQLKTRILYNHKARFHNTDDLKIYSKLIPGKYLNSEQNSEALKLIEAKSRVAKSGKIKYADKYFKLSPSKVSKAILAHLETDGNSYVHPFQNRSLTPREAARIQSFPDWYFFQGSFRSQYRQIGNAVPPLLAYKLAQVIRTELVKS
jgi:DNA (cytosine-5)-methyltransferase 1